jgi:hypothetical protein
MLKSTAFQHGLMRVLLVSLSGCLTPSLRAQRSLPSEPSVPESTKGGSQPTQMDEDKLAFIQAMMARSGEEGRFNDAQLQKRLNLIKSSPDLGRYLVEIADRLLASKDAEISDVLDAMAQRTDIDPQAIERYVSLAENTVKVKSFEELDRGQMAFLSGMTEILAAHPTMEHERLLIRIQQIGLGGMVAEALAKSGGAQALKALEQQVLEYEELMKRFPDNPSVRQNAQQIKSHLESLRRRLAQVDAKPGSAAMDVLDASKQKTPRQTERTTSKSVDITDSRTVWFMSFLTVIVVFFVIRKCIKLS